MKRISAVLLSICLITITVLLNAESAYAGEIEAKPLLGRTIYCVGDSITLAIGGNKDINGHYISYTDYIGEYSGAAVYNSSFEGVQIGDYGINNCIMQRLYNIPQNTDVIVFWAGVDDFIWGTPMNYERYKDDVDYAFAYMKNYFPNTKIVVVTTFKNRSEALRTDRGASLAQFMQYQADKANVYGFTVVDFYNMDLSLLSTPEYFADDIHPNDAGNRQVGKIIYEKILQGYILPIEVYDPLDLVSYNLLY